MDETIEEDVVEEIREQITEEPIKEAQVAEGNNIQKTNISHQEANNNHLSFNDIDFVKTDDGNITNVSAPKTIERLEEISAMRAEQRKNETDADEDDNVKLSISDQSFDLDNLDIHNIEEPKIDLLPDLLIDDIEVLN
jgi:hypothetical protein